MPGTPQKTYTVPMTPIIFRPEFSFNVPEISKTALPKLPAWFHEKLAPQLMQTLHLYDAKQLSHLFNAMVNAGVPREAFLRPAAPVTDEQLRKVHTDKVINSYTNSSAVAAALQIWSIAGAFNNKPMNSLIDPFRWQSAGTILAAEEALRRSSEAKQITGSGYALSIVLGGGAHHAERDRIGGFSPMSDIALAVERIKEQSPGSKVLIIDIDANHGNGYADIYKDDKDVYLMDVYNEDVFPIAFRKKYQNEKEIAKIRAKMHDQGPLNDVLAMVADAKDTTAKRVNFPVILNSTTTDEECRAKLADGFARAKETLEGQDVKILIVGGVDTAKGDRIGVMQLSDEAVINMHEQAVQFARYLNGGSPVIYTTSGGYTKLSKELRFEIFKRLADRGLANFNVENLDDFVNAEFDSSTPALVA